MTTDTAARERAESYLTQTRPDAVRRFPELARAYETEDFINRNLRQRFSHCNTSAMASLEEMTRARIAQDLRNGWMPLEIESSGDTAIYPQEAS